MSLKSTIARWVARRRVAATRRFLQDPMGQQQRLLLSLVRQAQNTAFGRDHSFGAIRTVQDFQRAVPIRGYEELRPYIDRAYNGEPDVLWPGKPLYFAKTSGTTSGTKAIPLTKGMMQKQVQGAKDALLYYIAETGRADFLDGKMIFLSGSPKIHPNKAGIPVGRLSGISQHFVPKYLQTNRLPSYATNCIEDWEQKVRTIVHETKGADLRLISGIPPWVQMYFEELRAQTGKSPAEVWPNMRLFVQGGVDYGPYSQMFTEALGRSVDVVEVYPASEGFIAVQNSQQDNGLLLILDSGLFFEFIPVERYGEPDAPRLTLADVQVGQNYALILSSNAGLWGYDIGDTVKFTSVFPHKIRVSGRVKHFISAFGEHVIQEEVNRAMMQACEETGAVVNEYTVAPFISQDVSYHEWLIEFSRPPHDLAQFRHVLDEAMRRQNVYYNDLRTGNMLIATVLSLLATNACRDYMKSVGKLGGQNKFQRLSNNRDLANALQPYVVSRLA